MGEYTTSAWGASIIFAHDFAKLTQTGKIRTEDCLRWVREGVQPPADSPIGFLLAATTAVHENPSHGTDFSRRYFSTSPLGTRCRFFGGSESSSISRNAT